MPPPNRGGQHKPSPTVNQRRIFRGRGGPTDGNLPPKKTLRVRVKYQHDVLQSDYNNTNASYLVDHDDVDINRLSLNASDTDRLNGSNKNHDSGCEGGGEEDNNNPLRKEISHLQKRIQNITLSIQSSPLGISNPNTWRTNCLNPIKNIMKEWRSILSFHCQEITGGGSGVCTDDKIIESQQHQVLESSNNISTKQTELQQLLHETSAGVFILLQMAMQTGPLVGSNPGYFKRCGGDVASNALEFLTDVIGLAGATASADDDDEIGGGNDNVDGEKNDDNEIDSPNSNDDSCASSSTDDNEEGESDEPANMALETPSAAAAAIATTTTVSAQAQELQSVQALQNSFLFTEKQSQRVHQWHRNALKVADSDKAPSKNASKLQGQKSKKQRMKDLKMERKLKKKNKGHGRK